MASGFGDGTYLELSDKLDSYIQEVLSVSDKLTRSEEDARKRMLSNVVSATGVGMTVLAMVSLLSAQPPETIARVLRVAKPEFANYGYADLLRGTKLLLLHEAVYQFGHGLRSVLAVLDPVNREMHQSKVIVDLLVRTDILDAERKLRPFLVAIELRNALRGAGIHFSPNDPTRTFHINGMEYMFQHGRRVQCDSWGHLLHLLAALLKVVDEVLSSPVVASLPFVPDARWTSTSDLDIWR